ncbi:MAG TPA: flagellar motor protein MotB [Polyangia bacterium]|nr:flagellar motor protein MotB [Polyangia bacterium]
MKTTAWDRTRSPEQEGVWLISYSDMMTLLLTFFVMLLSIAKVQKHRFEMISAALSQKKTENDLMKLERQVDQWIRDAKMEDRVVSDLGPEGLRVQFMNALLFESGKAQLTIDGQGVVDKFLSMLAQVDPSYRVMVEGYSDDVPISNAVFHSNWELSAQRAIEVLKRFVAYGVNKDRLSIQGFADTRPIRPKEMPHGLSPQAQLAYERSLNRRVVIVVY